MPETVASTAPPRPRYRLRVIVPAIVLIVAIAWALAELVGPAPPRRIVLATGVNTGMYHRYARRYVEILKHAGVKVEERMTAGAAENLALLLDPKSGVDVAFLLGGVAPSPPPERIVMLASLYYEPLWIFYRGTDTLLQINQLRGKRIAVGTPGSGTRAFVVPLLMANGIDERNTDVWGYDGTEAQDALRDSRIDAAVLVGPATAPLIMDALHNPAFKLMSLPRADVYPRLFPHVTRLTLPPGMIDLAGNVPKEQIDLIGTKAMLAARDTLHPALINLLIDAAREIHEGQGRFEAAGEFPGIAPVDLRVSPYADQHARFGSSLFYQYLPFWVATLIERMIIIVAPLIVVLIPLASYLPRLRRWWVRSRIYRWYGELTLLEREVHTREGVLPIARWLATLDRIESAVEGVKAPVSFASEAYTLREHIALVRRAVLARGTAVSPAAEDDFMHSTEKVHS
jgi:ABC-type nitrate/sulfonate/bicarbonate transport system substrate-binding protein